MTTWYVDQEAGTDANASAGNGDSFATRRKKISNMVAAAIAPADTIRVMASKDPTSLGITGVWTNGALPATVSITSSTNATPIVVTKVAHGLVNGDTIYIINHTTNTNANGTWEVANKTADTFELANSIGNGVGGASGTFRNINNCRITLASALTKNVASCGNRGSSVGIPTAWTASANVTATVSTADFKDGDRSDKIDIAAGFTTGLAAYWATGSALDFSGYKQVSFWIKQTSGTIGAAGAIQIKLCSDTVGATPVDTIDIPALGVLNAWHVFTVDKGSALGASIQSVAFSVVTDNAAQIFQISNIIACKDSANADSLTLTSLIGKNDGEWYGIQSINGTRVLLDTLTNTIPTSTVNRGYTGTTETVTTYKREPILTTPAAASSTIVAQLLDVGTVGNKITYSGGWNRTDMTTQTGSTFFDGQNGNGYGLVATTTNYNSVDKLNFYRYERGLSATANNQEFDIVTMQCANCNTAFYYNAGYHGTLGTIIANNSTAGFFIQSSFNCVITSVKANNCTTNNCQIEGTSRCIFGSIVTHNSGGTNVNGALYMQKGSNNNIIGSFVATGNLVAGIITTNACGNNIILSGSSSGFPSGDIGFGDSTLTLRNFTMGSSTETYAYTPSFWVNYRCYSEKHDGTAFNDKIFLQGGTISKVTDQLHGSSNYSWKFQPTHANSRSDFPLETSFAKIAVNSTGQVDLKVWVRVDDVNMFVKVLLRGGQIAGASADVSAVSTGASLNAWEQLTVSFTPTEKGVIEYVIQGYTDDGATTLNGWASDPSVTQV